MAGMTGPQLEPSRVIGELNRKIRRNCPAFRGEIPIAVGSSEGEYATPGKGQWTDGFWPGLLLLAYAREKDALLLGEYERFAEFLQERVENDPVRNEEQRYLPLDHDVGFIFHLTAVYHYMLSGSAGSRGVGLQAADELLSRYREGKAGCFIRAWDDWESDTPEFRREKKGKAIIDSLMNMPLLFWASEETGDRRYRTAAEAHIGQLATCIVREDGSTFHTFNFDPDTGAPVGGKTRQGYADASTWSRGQAWALYGFALAYRYTGEARFLQTSRRCAAYWMRSLLPGGDAPWDFGAPVIEGLPVDTSAMSIAACGMMELYRHQPEDQGLFDMVEGLAARLLQAHRAPPAAHAFLLHGSVGPAYSQGSREERERQYMYANNSLIYGDYFLYELLLRLEKGRGVILPWDFHQTGFRPEAVAAE